LGAPRGKKNEKKKGKKPLVKSAQIPKGSLSREELIKKFFPLKGGKEEFLKNFGRNKGQTTSLLQPARELSYRIRTNLRVHPTRKKGINLLQILLLN